jgi:hypothetical protein
VETFTRLFGSLLLFVYHCFDRVVINGYLSGLSRPGQVAYFFHNVVGEPVIGKEVLSRRTNEYQAWVEAYARNHAPIEWAEPKVRKEDYVRPALRRMDRAGQHGVYFILKSMEQGQTFRSTVPRFATDDPNYRILARQRSRFTHYYFYIRDETLGPMVMRVASFFPFQTTYYLNGHNFIEKELGREKASFRKNDNAFLAVSDPQALQAAADRFTAEVIRKRLEYWTLILGPKFSKRERAAMNLHRFYAVSQVEYCRNFIFKRNFPIHRIFERGCEIGLWRMTAHKIAEVFGQRVTSKLKGKLSTVVEQVEHGHHIFRAYYRNAVSVLCSHPRHAFVALQRWRHGSGQGAYAAICRGEATDCGVDVSVRTERGASGAGRRGELTSSVSVAPGLSRRRTGGGRGAGFIAVAGDRFSDGFGGAG